MATASPEQIDPCLPGMFCDVFCKAGTVSYVTYDGTSSACTKLPFTPTIPAGIRTAEVPDTCRVYGDGYERRIDEGL